MKNRWLIINADDAGLCPEVDEGILEAARAGRVTSVSLLVNPPFRPAVVQLKDLPLSIGLHLNLTLGLPMSPSGLVPLKQGNGRFDPRWLDEGRAFEAKEVRDELLRQVETFVTLTGAHPTHLDTHKHVHTRNREIFAVTAGLAKDLGVPLRASGAPAREELKALGVMVTDHFVGGVDPSPFWTGERLAALVTRLPPGITEMMCHPAKGMPAMEGLRYIRERDVERETLLSPAAGELFRGCPRVNFRTAPFRGAGRGM